MTYEDFGIDGVRLTVKGDQQVACPKCSNDRKKKNLKTLSVHVGKEMWNCHHCGAAGSIKTGWVGESMLEVEKVPQIASIELPKRQNQTNLNEAALNWFRGRGISVPTLERNQVSMESHWMPQTGKKENCIAFNYFEGDQLVNVKYRDGAKNFSQSKGGKKILYKLNDAVDAEFLVWAEGEMDALSWEECGIKNAVSVPDGAPSPTAKNFDGKFSYLENCADVIEAIDKHYIAADNDAPGRVLKEELCRRIGRHKCWVVEFPDDCKDANDVLVKYDSDTLRGCFDNAEPYPIQDILRVSDFSQEIDDLYENGIDTGITTGFNVGTPSFDELITWKTSMTCIVTGVPTHGKALSLDTIIPTVDGNKTMGEVQVGDELWDENGDKCRVINVTGVMYDRPCYEIEFNDGLKVVADENHKWLTDTWRSRRSESNAKKNGRLNNNSLKKRGVDQSDKREFASVKTTKEIYESVKVKNDNRNNHSINLCGEIVGSKKNLIIDPYVFGCWLGDGNSSGSVITCGDSQVLENIQKLGYDVSKQKTKYRYTILGLVSKLREIGVVNNKHIPMDYLRATKDQRMELLRGLMDTDGYVDTRGTCEFSTVRESIFNSVYDLLCGLGMRPKKIVGKAKLNGKVVGDSYRLQFTPKFNVFNIERKSSRVRNDYTWSKVGKRYIVSCKRVDSVPVKCIEVDSKSHLFLCTEGFLPTHNSTMMEQVMMLLNVQHGWKCGIFSPEHYPMSIAFNRVAKMYTGKPFFKGPTERMTKAELDKCKDYFEDNYYFIRPKGDKHDLDTILEAAAGLILRYGVKVVYIDPWNSMHHDMKGVSETDYIEQALNKINFFKQKHDVLVIIVAHPTKVKKNEMGIFEVPTLYDIKGSANWYNKPDYGLTVYRDFTEGVTKVFVQKVKYEHLGKVGCAEFKFNPINSRYYPFGSEPFNDMYVTGEQIVVNGVPDPVWDNDTVVRPQDGKRVGFHQDDDDDDNLGEMPRSQEFDW